jgi:Tol biopolymer transport system component
MLGALLKRLLLAAVPIALLISSCAAGELKPTTYLSDTGATLNADIYSSVAGDTEFWWRYGTTTDYGTETPHRTVAIADDEPHRVSQPVAGLTASTTYHFQLCARDDEESPPRTNCQTDGTFTTKSAGGRSGIAFAAASEIWVMNADGSDQMQVSPPSNNFDGTPRWSPDGTKIAWDSTRDDGYGDVFAMDADGSNATNLTDAPDSSDFGPAWSPDGSKILFRSDRDDNNLEIYVMDADGSNQTRLTDSPGVDFSPTWSPDGSRIAFTSRRSGDDFDIWVMNADGTDPVDLTNSPSTDWDPDWSPDGTQITWVSSRDSDYEVYVMNADGSDPTRVTHHPGQEDEPTWSPDGSRIVWTSFNGGEFPTPNIWTMNADGSDPVQLTSDETEGSGGWTSDWSPRP